MVQSQMVVLQSLTKGCKSAEAVKTTEELPEGCAADVVTADVTVHLMVRVSFTSLPFKKVEHTTH